jgi:uncharacterized membrane protein HdeD (DUF308 family)
MENFKKYGWVLFITGASLLFALAVFLFFEPGQAIVIPFVGAIILISSVVRLVPYVNTQKSDLVKTINIIEITIDVLIGLIFLLVPTLTSVDLGVVFGWLLGFYLMLRGSVHFFGVSKGQEQSDFPLYIYHIATLIVGSYVAFSGFNAATLILLIQIFSIIAGGYLGYSGYGGYKQYRYQKTLYMPDTKNPNVVDEKHVPTNPSPHVEKEEPLQDHVS